MIISFYFPSQVHMPKSKANKPTETNNPKSLSPDHVLQFFKTRARQKIHHLKAKVMQYQEKTYPQKMRTNCSIQKLASNYLEVQIRKSKLEKAFRLNSETIEAQQYQPNPQIQPLSEQDQIYLDNPILSYNHRTDEGKKWKINFAADLDLYLVDSIQFLAILLAFQNGYYPLTMKSTSKYNFYVQYMQKLKKRPSKMVEAFKVLIGGLWLVFAWTVCKFQEKQKSQEKSYSYSMCVSLLSIKQQVNHNKIDFILDRLFDDSDSIYTILPGQVVTQTPKLQVEGEVFRFHQKNFRFQSSKNGVQVRRIFPSLVLQQKYSVESIDKVTTLDSFTVETKKDETNYESVRYIYAQLADSRYFNYSLSNEEFDLLETKGNVIAVGRSGTGKTTCALLRLFFKEMNKNFQIQKNVFLTASPVLIAQISKKYTQLKMGITNLHDHDYFNKINSEKEEEALKRFLLRLDQEHGILQNKKSKNFLDCNKFPCFITIRDYIESLDSCLQNPFFTVQKQSQNEQLIHQFEISYPDEIQWQLRPVKFRKTNINSNTNNQETVEQQWYEIDFNYFAKTIWNLPQIQRIHCFSPQIVWSQIFSTIKGSSRAHSFFYKFLDFQTYCNQSKNTFLGINDKQKIYEVFKVYETWKQSNHQYDLTDVVNNILIELKKKQQNNLYVTSLFVDQVQDLPPSFIFLVGKVVQQSLFFSGDTAQTIAKGVNFSFEDVRQQFSQKYFQNNFKLQKPILKKLYVNFRSQNEIIQLSNSLVKILTLMFPQSIDRMPFEVSNKHGLKPLIISKSNQEVIGRIFRQNERIVTHNTNNLFGADKVIIVRRKEDKEKVPSSLKNMTCLTYEECKGLQYNVVILYDFFASHNAQWSFLKHIQLQNSKQGKQLYFDKKKLGSNKKAYFQLCSEMKILYTIITRPRSIFIICDDNVPQELERIWNFLGLTERLNGNYSYSHQMTEQIQTREYSISQNNKAVEKKFSCYKSQQKTTNKFFSEWVDDGFKFFFERKLYSDAAKCFKNIGFFDISKICWAFQFATHASSYSKGNSQKNQYYINAGKIFEEMKRLYDAGKCFYLGESYQKALLCFKTLKIRKYEAECLWLLKNFLEAQKIFFEQNKIIKGLKVLIDSNYWYLFLKNLYTLDTQHWRFPQNFIANGLEKCLTYLLRDFSEYIIESETLQKIYKLSEQLVHNLTRRYGDPNDKKINYFDQKQNFFESEEKKSKTASFQQLGQKRQSGETYRNVFAKLNQKEVFNDFITLISYTYDKLKRYNSLLNLRKYNYKNLGYKKEQLEVQSDDIILTQNIGMLFQTLQTFNCQQLIMYLTKMLKLPKIQQILILELFLKIPQNSEKQNYHTFLEKYHSATNYMISKKIASKLSILVLLFGKLRGAYHFSQNQDQMINIYLDNWEKDLENEFLERTHEIKPHLIKNNYKLRCFNLHLKRKLHGKQLEHSAFYKSLFYLVDDLSPCSYFFENIKQKEYLDYYQKLTKQEKQHMEAQIFMETKQATRYLNEDINYYKKLIQGLEQRKQKIILQTSNEEIQAFNKKLELIPYIKEYINLPEENLKNPNIQVYKPKIRSHHIKQQKQQILNNIDKKIKDFNEIQMRKANSYDEIEPLEGKINDLQQQLKKKNQSLIKFKQEQRQKCSELEKTKLQLQDLYLRRKQQKINLSKTQIWKTELKQKEQEYNSIIKIKTNYIRALQLNIKQQQKQVDSLTSQISYRKQLIVDRKNYICSQGLGKLNAQGKLKLKYDASITRDILRETILEKVIKPQKITSDNKKNQKSNLYAFKMAKFKEYVHYHQRVPKKCQQKRDNVFKDLEENNKILENCYKQKESTQISVKAQTENKFRSQVCRMKIHLARKCQITQKILSAQIFQKELSDDFLLILEIISLINYSRVPKILSKSEVYRISNNLQLISQLRQDSLEVAWFFMFWILHPQQIKLIQSIVTNNVYSKFLNSLSMFIENVLYLTQFDKTMKNIFSVMGIKVIESLDKDDFQYLEGFSIIHKKHNFIVSLKNQFAIKIGQQHYLCNTHHIVKELQREIKKIISASSVFRQIVFMDQSQLKQTEIQPDLNLRNSQSLQQFRRSKGYQLSDWKNAINYDEDNQSLYDLDSLKRILSEMKMIQLCQITNCEQNKNLVSEEKATQISNFLSKLILITQMCHDAVIFNQNMGQERLQQHRNIDIIKYTQKVLSLVIQVLCQNKKKTQQERSNSTYSQISRIVLEQLHKQQYEELRKESEYLSRPQIIPAVEKNDYDEQVNANRSDIQQMWEDQYYEEQSYTISRKDRHNFYVQHSYQFDQFF